MIVRGPNDWTAERIQKLWDYQSSRPDAESSYFGFLAGAAVVRWLQLNDLLRGQVLDYGCGGGHVVERLSRLSLDVYGTDPSEHSVSATNRRCSGLPGFRAALPSESSRAPWPDATFDLVLCCETVEHVTAETADALYREQHRLLKPGGMLVVTTPASEDLSIDTTYCPFCDSQFHRWQHMRSISPESLREALQAAGFDVLQCAAIDLNAFDPQATLTRVPRFRRLVSWSWKCWLSVLQRLSPKSARQTELWLRSYPGRHLTAIARRR
jgi:2-polyprenyl-3-methyl-5-hydroxy-6-metoxy-1,4-benzoquinol methylase